MSADPKPQRPVPLILLIGSVFVVVTVVEVLLGGVDRSWLVSGALLVGEFVVGVVLAVAVWTLIMARRD